mmetsp:Transcript_50219/g.132197  ORF Transcript_50219/g.132197 Transcript_50219/m.132197 type:complete len:252 (-) Transcript_50219:3-758(-)
MQILSKCAPLSAASHAELMPPSCAAPGTRRWRCKARLSSTQRGVGAALPAWRRVLLLVQPRERHAARARQPRLRAEIQLGPSGVEASGGASVVRAVLERRRQCARPLSGARQLRKRPARVVHCKHRPCRQARLIVGVRPRLVLLNGPSNGRRDGGVGQRERGARLEERVGGDGLRRVHYHRPRVCGACKLCGRLVQRGEEGRACHCCAGHDLPSWPAWGRGRTDFYGSGHGAQPRGAEESHAPPHLRLRPH